jgi:hypothetical protein
MSTIRIFRTVLLATVPLHAGCILLAAPLAPLVGGLLPSDNKVVIDEKTVTPELRTTLAQTKKWTFVDSDKSDAYMGELLEQHGYEVAIEDSPKSATQSQKRKQMEAICARPDRPELVFSSSTGETDIGTGTTLKGLATGRAYYDVSGTEQVLRCRDKWSSEFALRAEISQGIYNEDKTKLAQIMGQEFAKALMQAAGTLPLPPPDQKAERTAATTP